VKNVWTLEKIIDRASNCNCYIGEGECKFECLVEGGSHVPEVCGGAFGDKHPHAREPAEQSERFQPFFDNTSPVGELTYLRAFSAMIFMCHFHLYDRIILTCHDMEATGKI